MTDRLVRLYQRMPRPARELAANARALYLRTWRYGADAEERVAEALERDTWTAEQWQRWREERQALVLHRAATQVPYYRAQWSARRQRGDQSAWDRLEHWPILEKEAVRAAPAAFVADDRDRRTLFHEHTSGSTGTPLDLWQSRETVRQWYALLEARTRRWYGVRRSDGWAILGGQPVVPARVTRPPFWVWHAPLHQLYLSTNHFAPAHAAAYARAITERAVTHMVVYPSAAALLAHAIEASGVAAPGLRVVVSNAEPLHGWQREVIGRGFGCAVRETYGMAELVAAASECAHGTLHLWPDVGVVETIEDAAADGGDAGRLICTGLLNADMPLIRYAVGDRGRPVAAGVCACGRQMPALASLEGRTSDFLRTADGRVVHWINPIFYGLPIREAQVVQESLAHVRIAVVPAAGFGAAASALVCERLRMRLGDARIELELVERIPRERSGKLRLVVSRIAQQAPSPA